jgi:hypothetical protein
MATDFLNSGDWELGNAARKWAKEHGFGIMPSHKSSGVRWGSHQ